MNQKLIKAQSLLLAVLLACSSILSACGGKQHGADTVKTAPQNPVEPSAQTTVNDSLHKINVTENDRVFIKEGDTEYKIISSSDAQTEKAVSNLITYVSKGTGAVLSRATAEEFSSEGKFIVFNMPELFSAAGLTMPEDELGDSGYYIKTKGDNVYLAMKSARGAQFAMISFLKHVLGFTMYAADTIEFRKDGSTMPDMEIIERPDIEHLHNNNAGGSYDLLYMMGYSTIGEVMYAGGKQWHNTLGFLPMAKYMEDHPDWYSTYGNDLCFTARGNENELTAMIEEIAGIVLETANLPENLDKPFISVSTMDVNQSCECDKCNATAEKYGGAYSAAVIQFLNRVNKIVQDELQKQADAQGVEKRTLYILMLAYKKYQDAPVLQNTDGTYSPMDESVVCDPNLGVMYAPIFAKYNVPFTNEVNASQEVRTRGWAACSNVIYAWLYETNFVAYMYPYNSWDSAMETYRLLDECNVRAICSQGQWNTWGHTGFTDFKDYINTFAIWGLDTNFAEIKEDYFNAYFRAGAEPMLTYFDELNAYMRYLQETYPAEFNGGIYDKIDETKYWPISLLLHWQDLINEAYEAIEIHRDQKTLYQTLHNHITNESLFVRYALIVHHGGKFSALELQEMKLSFVEDAKRLGVKRVGEGGTLDEVLSRWNID